MKTKLSLLIALLVGLFLLPTSSYSFTSSDSFTYTDSFYLDSFNLNDSTFTYPGPYVEVDWGYDTYDPNGVATSAMIRLTGQTIGGYTYSFNQIGLNTYGTVLPPSSSYEVELNPQNPLDHAGYYSQILTGGGNQGFNGSITELIFTVSGLNGQLFEQGEPPIAAHIFAKSGTSVATGFAYTDPPSPTPIPAAAWLMASGLLALIGLNRRRADHTN